MANLARDWLLDPLGLVVLWTLLLCAAGALLGPGRRRRHTASRTRRLGRRLGFFAAWYAGLAAVSAPAIVNPLVASLEGAVPVGACPPGTPIVALGGGIDGAADAATSFEAMDRPTLARVAEAGRLAAAEPGARVVVAGGPVGPGDPGGPAGAVAEADVMARWLAATGTPRAGIVVERRSTSTATNAREVRSALPDAREVRLVTSALHMPRALGAFRAAGFDPCPVPVDRIAHPDVPAWALWPQVTALEKFDEWLHETLALALYRYRGDVAAAGPARAGPAAGGTSWGRGPVAGRAAQTS